jgi:hypothetical protein
VVVVVMANGKMMVLVDVIFLLVWKERAGYPWISLCPLELWLEPSIGQSEQNVS